MRKNLLRISILMIGIIFALQIKAAAIVKSTDKSVTGGENVTISVTSSVALGSYKVALTDAGGLTFVSSSGGEKSADQKTVTGSSTSGTTSLATYTFKTPTVDSDKKYTVKFKITAMEGTDLTEYPTENNSATITVKAKTQTPPKTDTNNNNGNTAKPKEPTFTKVNETVYVVKKVNVRQSYSTSSKSLGTLEVGTSLTRTGKGSNGWSRVSYNGKEAYINASYLSTKKPEDKPAEETPEEKSNNKGLKSLTVTPGELTPAFDVETTRYNMQVAQDITEVTIEALAEDEKATVEVIGNKELKLGENEVTVKVTAEDETVRIYTIIVLRGEAVEEPQLSMLNVKNGKLNPIFQADVYSYELTLTADTDKLDLELMTLGEDVKYEVVGNENIQDGSVVKIIVYTGEKDADGSVQTEYQITIKKNGVAVATNNTILGMDQRTFIIIATIVLVTVGVIALIVARYFTTKGEGKKKQETEEGDFGVFDGLSRTKKQRRE